MARNRMIKADFWADEKIGNISTLARLLFIGTWNFADDSGICRANEVYLRNNIFPYDDISLDEIKNAIRQLCSSGVVVLLEYSGERYLKIKNFLKHQTINKPSKFRYIDENKTQCSNSVVVVEELSPPKEKEKENVKEKSKENILGEFKNIFLSNEKLEELKNLYGSRFNEAIEVLSSYVQSSGKKYKDFYAVLNKHNWVYKKIFGDNQKQDSLEEIQKNGYDF